MLRLLQFMATNAERRPGRSLAVVAAVTVVLAIFAAQQSTDTNVTAFAPGNERAAAFDRVQNDFAAGGSVVRVVVDTGPSGNVFDPRVVAIADRVADDVAADPAIAAVLAPTTPDGIPPVRSFADPAALALDGQPLPEGAERMFAANLDVTNPTAPYARGGIVAIVLDPSLDEQGALQATRLVADVVDTSAAPARGLGVEVVAFSNETLAASMQEATDAELPRLLGLSLLIIIGVLILLFRRVSDVAIGMVGLLATLVWMNGFAVILGPGVLGWLGPFTQISTIIPVLLVGLGVDYAIHLTSRYREEQRHGLGPSHAGPMAVRTVGGALALATLTTMVGFLTNVVSPLPPVSDFGIFTAIGILSAFVVMTTVVPSARVLLDRRAQRRQEQRAGTGIDPGSDTGTGPDGVPPNVRRGSGRALGTIMSSTATLAERAPRITLAVAAVVTAIAAVGAFQLETSFSQDDFIPPDSFAGQVFDLVDDVFGGDLTETTFVVIDGEVGSPATTAAIDRAIANLGGVADVRTSATGPVVSLRQPQGGSAGIADSVVLEVATTAGTDRGEVLATGITAAMEPVVATGATVQVTSEPLVVLDTLDALTTSQLRGIAITLAAAVLLLALHFGITERRPLLGAITMVPSLAVVLWILGTMWVLGLTINVLTAMIASLAIGIGVPFGIHITNRFLEDRRRYGDTVVAVRQTVVHTGGAVFGSAATTAAGFGVLYLSSVMPIRQFGAVVAITIIYSLLAAVLIQPSCLRLWADRQGSADDTPGLRDHEVRPDAPPTPASVASH